MQGQEEAKVEAGKLGALNQVVMEKSYKVPELTDKILGGTVTEMPRSEG